MLAFDNCHHANHQYVEFVIIRETHVKPCYCQPSKTFRRFELLVGIQNNSQLISLGWRNEATRVHFWEDRSPNCFHSPLAILSTCSMYTTSTNLKNRHRPTSTQTTVFHSSQPNGAYQFWFRYYWLRRPS